LAAAAEDDHGGLGSAFGLPSVLFRAGVGHGLELSKQDLADPPPAESDDRSPVEPAPDLPSEREYKFRLDDNFFRLRARDSETVGDVKVKIAERESTTPDWVTLLYTGKALKDRMVLRGLKVPQDGHFVVYIRSNRSILLFSAC
jgi:hypothetical protein